MEESVSAREDIDSEDLRELYGKYYRMQFMAKMFIERDEWKQNLLGLKVFTVIKMPRVL